MESYTFVDLETWSLNVPFLMDKLDAASADTGVVEWLVLGPLWTTYPTDVRCTVGKQQHSIQWDPTPAMFRWINLALCISNNFINRFDSNSWQTLDTISNVKKAK